MIQIKKQNQNTRKVRKGKIRIVVHKVVKGMQSLSKRRIKLKRSNYRLLNQNTIQKAKRRTSISRSSLLMKVVVARKRRKRGNLLVQMKIAAQLLRIKGVKRKRQVIAVRRRILKGRVRRDQ